VSLGLYRHDDDNDLTVLRRQAVAAVAAGFAGVTLAEHHNARSGYVAHPQAFTAALLPVLGSGWVAAAPTILNLRPPRAVAEDLIWTNAMHPGRVGLAVGAGFDREDFDLYGVPFDGRLGAFRRLLAELARTRIDHPPFGTGAIADLPVIVATRGARNVEAAAHAGFGLLLPPLPAATARELSDRFRASGGRGPVVLGRWAFLGEPPIAAVAALNGAIAATEGDLSWRDADSVITVDSAGAPGQLATQLADHVIASGADHLHLRIHLPGLAPAVVDEQIAAVGAMVVPEVQARLAAR
jgi:alkanesulfonate monooxygenase SsuD/methylene tetrahydromethanopterin reductase-like flavin-dependent oxidoreductase (luciferase family)